MQPLTGSPQSVAGQSYLLPQFVRNGGSARVGIGIAEGLDFSALQLDH